MTQTQNQGQTTFFFHVAAPVAEKRGLSLIFVC